jgi:hypothetical protein
VPLTDAEARAWRILRQFKSAADTATSLAFPPGDPEERAVVHRIAHILGLQHRSKGKGAKHRKQRYVTVSHSCACVGSPCLMNCVHGASIGDEARGGGRQLNPVTTAQELNT